MNNCIKCGNIIQEKSESVKYCSPRCSKLYLKSQYKKRKREQLNEYNKEYRSRGIQGGPSNNTIISDFAKRNGVCARCGTSENLHCCHIKPRDAGGKNRDNLIRLCQKCHHEFDYLLKIFWK